MAASPSAIPPTKRQNLFWSRYIRKGHGSQEEFDLHRFFEDAEYVAIKVALLASLVIILWFVVRDHVPKAEAPSQKLHENVYDSYQRIR